MSIVQTLTRKSMVIRPSGRSTDYISPSFGFGCLYNCSYCYLKRHKPEGLDIATNTVDILTAIDHHSWFADAEKPNQTHEQYITYDISCNEDFALHAKQHEWQKIFGFFRDHSRAMASFATKYVNPALLTFDPKQKVRVRFSLMPIEYSLMLEPNTSNIWHRIYAINDFIEAGYDVHINFSPVIVGKDWLDKYRLLFAMVDTVVKPEYKDRVKAEVIFMTHNEQKHKYNLKHNLPGEDLLWVPQVQESKVSQYGGTNIRYKHDVKAEYIRQWTAVHDEVIPWNTIRYIF
jgi:spore photoproduct lyase